VPATVSDIEVESWLVLPARDEVGYWSYDPQSSAPVVGALVLGPRIAFVRASTIARFAWAQAGSERLAILLATKDRPTLP